MKVLFIGDIFGNPGRRAVKEMLPILKKEMPYDYCIANGENAAGGTGITNVIAQELYKYGVDLITMGNHTWSKREITNFIDDDKKIIRPVNFPEGLPGRGSAIIDGKLGVINAQGGVYMDNIDCPFRAVERELETIKKSVKVVIVDMHAEASSEKCALAWHIDGKASCVVGTHTHVQTADERILPFGTGFITDVGMTGPHEGIIGVDKDIVIEKFLTHMPARFEVAKGSVQFNALHIEIDEKNGKAIELRRISRVFNLNENR